MDCETKESIQVPITLKITGLPLVTLVSRQAWTATPCAFCGSTAMAQLIITDEERAATSYLDWDDASIGRGVKKIAMKIEDIKGEDAISWCAGAMSLLSRAIEANSEETTMTIEGLVSGGKSLGDWEVTVRKLSQ